MQCRAHRLVVVRGGGGLLRFSAAVRYISLLAFLFKICPSESRENETQYRICGKKETGRFATGRLVGVPEIY